MDLVIKTMEGLEEVLAKELENLQLLNIKVLKRAVSCEGSWAQLYKCNYQLRTALRVLLPIMETQLETQDDLYDAVYSINWKDFVPPKKSIAINGTISGELFKHSQYPVFRAKDAIVDNLRDAYGDRTRVDTSRPDILIDLYISDNRMKLSLDSSGRSLHLRNYKYRQYKAPLNEVLASGIIQLAEWDGQKRFHDPMSGSGTFITEALMIAANIPAGMFNPSFSFENWHEFHPDIWKVVKESADAAIVHPECELLASDIHPLAVRDTKKNLQKFPFREKVHVFSRDFFTLPGQEETVLFMNPPYNRRIELDDINLFYKKLGDQLKMSWSGSEAWIISGNAEAMKNLGLRPSRRIALNHGGMDAKLYKFEMYEGSKKAKYQV